jgi:hypothetical protein
MADRHAVCSPPRVPFLARFTPFAAVALLASCIPNSPYRYSAMIPAARPLAWDGRTAQAGTLRVEGALSRAYVYDNPAPHLHDSALLVPELMVDGAAAIAVTRGFEMGARVAYASYEWTVPSADGTMPIPSRPSLFGAGPELRGTIYFGKSGFGLGFAGNVLHFDIPYAEWAQTTPGSAVYRLDQEGSDGFWTTSVGVYPSYSFGPQYGHIFASLTAHTAFKNDGFTDAQSIDGRVQTAGFVPILSVGYGVDIEVVRVSGRLYMPLSDGGSTVSYAPGVMFTVGLHLPLWGTEDKGPPPEPAVASRGLL